MEIRHQHWSWLLPSLCGVVSGRCVLRHVSRSGIQFGMPLRIQRATRLETRPGSLHESWTVSSESL
jgi:hypothetical protein